MSEKDKIKKDESPLRKMLVDSHGSKYRSLKSLNEARHTKNAYLIMEGDDGGQIYLVIPIRLVKCDEKILGALLKDLDFRVWNDISMANIYYEIYEPHTIVGGGMGGGKAEGGLWVHEDFENIKNKIAKVLNGLSTSLN